jgi:DNA-binding GntR family transcriptional regulator
MPSLAPLNDSPSLDKLAYEKIKEAILTFKFLPNQSLVEGELASQLAISKTPVRDALMRLEKEGLVTRIAYKGTYISDINNQDMANIYEIRIVLEGLAIHLATPLLTEKDLDYMQELIDDHSKALKAKDVPRVMEANSKFHNTIIGKCSNPRLQDMLYNLDDHLKRYRMLSISQGLRLEKSVPEHAAILKALRERDPEKAEQALKDHLFSAMHDLYDQDFEELERHLHTNP